MRETKQFGKRTKYNKLLPEKNKLKETFGIVNDGYLSNKAKKFIEDSTSLKLDDKEGDKENEI